VRRKSDESEAVQDGHFLRDVSPAPTGHLEEDAVGELGSKSPVLRLFPPLPGGRLSADSFVEGLTRLPWRSPKIALLRTIKACILAVKVRFQYKTDRVLCC
jgi:hypothetical protein